MLRGAARCLALVLVGLIALPAEAKGPPRRTARAGAHPGRVTFRSDWETRPSARYGAMAAEACLAELGRRGIEFTRVEKAPGVLAPVRIPKGAGGVIYRTDAAPAARPTNPFDVFDCRLVLALSDFSRILQAHDIDEVLMFSAWRPPSKAWPEGKLGTRHPGGLAIDAYRFGKKLGDGEAPSKKTWVTVQTDFGRKLGASVCGTGAAPATPEARELHSIVCEASDARIFTSILTPNYDRAHFNHFHLEVTPGVEWALLP